MIDKMIEEIQDLSWQAEKDIQLSESVEESNYYGGLNDAYEKCIKIAEKYKAQESSWISVEERLPDESLNSVLGWDAFRERCVFVQYWNGRFVLGNDIESVKVIAWMPLPEYHIDEADKKEGRKNE